MKRLLATATFLICSLLTTFAQFSGSGNGTEDDPYLIFNETQLSQVSNFLNQEGVVFKLMKDLDLTDWIAENNPRQGWLPIGVESMPFMGKFLGNNHKVSGLMINRSSTDYVGFFGYISGASIDNLTIEGSSVMGASNVGGFLGYASGSEITNCNLSLTTGVEGISNVGGFVGQSLNSNYSTFNVEASVKAQSYLGGFVGLAEGGNWQQGFVSGQRTSTGEYAGGFAGKLTSVTLSDIKQKGNVSSQDYTGGFVGCSSNGKFTRCDVESNVQGAQYVSGFAGALEVTTSSFNTCFHKGTITATGDYAGGIVGVSRGGCIEEMESCAHFGDMQGQNYVGGLIGAVMNIVEEPVLHIYHRETSYYTETITTGSEQYRKINNCIGVGNIIGLSFVGGLSGYDTTSKSFTSGSIYEEASYYSWMHNGKVYTEYRYFYNENGESVGKTLTYYKYTRNTIDLSYYNNSYCGTIQGTNNVGGLVGYKSGGFIQNNYANGNVFASNKVGGIVGQINSETGNDYFNTTTIKSNVAIVSTISATTSNVGRIYGLIDEEHTTIGALGSSETNRALAQAKVVLSGVVQDIEDDLQNGTSIGPSALKLKANYVSWGWNFDENWNILEAESFPYKKYQAAPPVIESELVSQATSISGKSIDGGTVYLYYKDRDAISTESSNYKWAFNTEALQSGATVQIYADVEEMFPSYFTTATVGYPGSGTEADPWRIYTAEDLQGACNKGYYKVMNDIDLTQWINENSPVEGWPAIGRNSGEATYIDGGNHKITGLWINTAENYNGLFSNFSAGQIKNLNVEVAAGKKVKGGDYTGILIGRNANGIIENCTVKGDVEGTLHVGGVAGFTEATTISTILFDGSVTTTSENAFVGSIAGQMKNCTVSNCDAEAALSTSGAGSKVGGLTGETIGGSITKATINNALAATGADSYVGGLVGYAETPVTLSMTSGNVSATGDNSYTGGLVGYALSHIANCYSVANVTGTQFSAGLVGYTFSTIDKCYAKGDIYGVMYGGGVVGELDGPNASLTNSVAACNILSLSAQSSWGCRVIGGFKNGAADPDMSNYALNTMQVSLNNVPQKKTDDLVEGVAKTDDELKTSSTYTALGWDLSSIWSIDDGNGYPYLIGNVSSQPVTSVSFDFNTITLSVGSSKTIKANVLPEDAVNKELYWESSNNDVATVSNGVVTAVGEGSATITATTTDGSNIKASCEVTVSSQGDVPMVDDTDISQLANAVYIESTEVKTGSQMTLSIKMKNETPIRGFQFDLYLPDGVTVAKNAKDRIMASLSAGRLPEDDEHSLTTGELTDGAIRFLCSSLYNENFTGNDGEIVTLTVNVSDDMEDGDYPIIIKNARLTETDISKYYIIDYVKSTLTVSSYMLGDINADNEVDVRDYTGVANYIMGNMPEGFVLKAGDIDENGDIDVRDYTGVANIIMGSSVYGSTHNSVRALKSKTYARVASNIDGMDNVIYATNAKGAPGSQIELSICMKNQTPIRGFQFDLHLPEGVSVVKNAKGRIMASLAPGRLPEDDEHTLVIDEVSDGVFRFLCSSLYDENFTGNEGEIVTLTVNIDANMAYGDYAVLLKNIIMTETDISKFYKADNIESVFTVEVSTGVSTLQDELLDVGKNNESPIYSIDGQLVGRSMDMSKSKKGIYIRDGKKIVVK